MDNLIPKHESLTIEFKSDRKRLAYRELVEAAVCLIERSHNYTAILSVRSEREIFMNKKCYKELSVRLR
jgi:hypothetical protein